MGECTTRATLTSQLSGPVMVEDVVIDGDTLRRLVSMESKHIAQPEAKMVPSSKQLLGGKSAVNMVVDREYLSCDHHKALVVGYCVVPQVLSWTPSSTQRVNAASAATSLAASARESSGIVCGSSDGASPRHGGVACRTLIVGLGGGSLPLYLLEHIPGTDVTVAELDPATR